MATATEERVLATNRAAFHNYHISAKYEAGAALMGTEVKSVLDGRIQLKESYVAVRDGEAWLFNAHISPIRTAIARTTIRCALESCYCIAAKSISLIKRLC